MKRFVSKLLLFILIIVVVDVVVGLGLDYLTSQITIGGQGRDNYIANIATEDILVLGSSRAVHHYNAQMIEDSIGMRCYNCGDDGAGIILSYGRLLMIKERHQPQIIIQDVYPDFDLMVNDNHKYLGWLKSHYNNKKLHPIFESVDKKERFKMVSHLYRNNSRFLQNIIVFVTGRANDEGVKGFRPNKGHLDRMKIKEERIEQKRYEYDTIKLEYINKLIDLADKSELVFVVSPIWYGMDSVQFQPLRDLCEKRGVCFIDFSNNPKYIHNDEYFKDGKHLNNIGADEFTKDLIVLLKKNEAKNNSCNNSSCVP